MKEGKKEEEVKETAKTIQQEKPTPQPKKANKVIPPEKEEPLLQYDWFYFPIGVTGINKKSSPKLLQVDIVPADNGQSQSRDIWGLSAGIFMSNNGRNLYGMQISPI